MKKIANIVSTHKVDVSEYFNVVESMDQIIHGLPTLIVDYYYVDKNYPNFDIGDSRLEDNLYWTFKRTHKRDKYNEDLDCFVRFVYYNLIKDVNYLFVDPIQYPYKSLRKAIKKIHSIDNLISYKTGNMMYIYGEKLIFGIDLKLLNYMGFDTSKLLTKIIAKSSVFLEDENIFIEYKQIIDELDKQIRFIPYLHSILNEKNSPSSVIHIP
jgi:hypothetical protein